jgi:hypothetical protein
MRAACRAALDRHFPGPDGPLCLCVAVMRLVAQLDTDCLLAAAVSRLTLPRAGHPWRLLIVGDGPARPKVEVAMATLPADRIRFLGSLEPEALPPIYLGADLLAFPGIGEDYGLVYLEAAAAGLPIVACRGPVRTSVCRQVGAAHRSHPRGVCRGAAATLEQSGGTPADGGGGAVSSLWSAASRRSADARGGPHAPRPPMNRSVSVILVRHGATAWTAEGVSRDNPTCSSLGRRGPSGTLAPAARSGATPRRRASGVGGPAPPSGRDCPTAGCECADP